MTTARDTSKDVYRSRVDSRPSLTDRPDPVVWSDLNNPPPGPLTAEQLRTFDKNGFLWLEGLFNEDEVKKYQGELERMSNDQTIRDRPTTVIELQSDEVRSIFEMHKQSEIFKEVVKDPRVSDAARQILGSDVYIHQARVNMKPAMSGGGFFWHSDFETWHTEDGMPRARAVSASVALTENNEFNGPLMVIPGSHRTFVSCVGSTPDDNYKNSLRKQELGVPDAESMTKLVEKYGGITAPKGPAGSVLLFDCNIMHGSTENISPWPRSNVFFVFNSVENTLIEPYAGTRPRPEYIATHDFTPVSEL
ncbi:MAG: ectoine hydroxylase [Dehalococcoidia bacterium]